MTTTNSKDYNYIFQSKEWDLQYEVDLYGSTAAKTTSQNNSTITTTDTIKVANIDGVMKLGIQKDTISSGRKLLLIIMVDKSRSIQTAWNQIQSTLLNVMASVISSDMDIVTELIFYNDTSFRLNWTKENYKEKILNERPSGRTCFASAFSLCGDLIRAFYQKGINAQFVKNTNTKSYDPNADTAVVFLTDGSHTTNRDHKKAFNDLRSLIDTIDNATITVHTMGFTPNSKFNDLDGIRRLLGNKPGIYQYAESTDGLYALKDKLSFIFKCIFTTSESMQASIEIKSDSIKFLESKSSKKSLSLLFNKEGACDLSLGIYSENIDYQGPIEIELVIGDKLFVHRASVLPHLNFGEHFQYFSSLTRLDVELSTLLTTIKSHKDESTKPTDAEKTQYLQSVLQHQKSLSEFDNITIMKFPSMIRSDIVALKQSCLDLSSKLMEILNLWNRSAWSSESNQKLADISYQFVFKNSGRQRRISHKVAKNIQSISNDSSKLKALEIDLDVFEDIEDKEEASLLESSKALFACILSLSDWVELLEEKDILGFGLSIQRPESVIDDPTQIRIIEVSTTFLGKSSIEDAIALSVDVHGQEKTTGGFEVGAKSTSVAVRGRGREPINSWLPLYLHKEHWNAIKYQLKNIIAYFVTLDPLAFSYDQINAIFLVVGTMISKDDIGERQLFVIFQLIRTLKEIVAHFNYLPRIKAQLKAMLKNSIYLISEQPKNLYVLISYCLVLNNSDLTEIFSCNDLWLQFWENVLESTIRRGFYSIFNQFPQTKVDSFLSDIFYGIYSLGLACPTTDDNNNNNNNSDTPTTTDVKDENDPDSLMAELLNYKYEKPNIVNYEFEKYLDIKQTQYIKDDPRRKNIESLNRSKLNSIIKLSLLLEEGAYPSVSSLINIMKFLKQWRLIYKDESIWSEIDERFGIPPDQWISSMKDALKPLDNCKNNNGFATYLYNVNYYYGEMKMSNQTMIQQIRSMIAQGIIYRINRVATAAVEEGKCTNSFRDPILCLKTIQHQVDTRYFSVVATNEVNLKFSQVTQSGLKSSNMTMFYNTIPDLSDQNFPVFVLQFIHPSRIVFAQQKLTSFLANIIVSLDDYGNSNTSKIRKNTWNLGKKYWLKLARAWGTDKIHEIWKDALFYRFLHESKELPLLKE